MAELDYDYIIIGSGFGGSVSALRLSEKGYRVLVIEKGKWFKDEDFAENNWDLKRWLWLPKMGMRGIFRITFMRHITVLSGVGVGGGSLTYANTLPVPKPAFFKTGSWNGLADWEAELAPHYTEAYRMLGAEKNPRLGTADKAVEELAKEIGREDHFEPSKVAVYFGQPGKTVPDPYFGGKGPDRTGCIHCGACMTGCKHNAKNTLDKNYLYLAQQLGAKIQAESEVFDVNPLDGASGATGYRVKYKSTGKGKKVVSEVTAKGVVFAAGVMGTMPLLLGLKNTSLPRLSDRLGEDIRTNNEALVTVTSLEKKTKDYTRGIAIGSVLHTDEHSHLEPVRYGEGSGFFRLMTVPMAFGKNVLIRGWRMWIGILKQPIKVMRTLFSSKYSRRTSILLFMQHLDSTIKVKKGRLMKLRTKKGEGPSPSPFIPRAGELAKSYEKIVKGKAFVGFTETLMGIPSTAHILGGAVMGATAGEGVIDKDNKVFGYENMMVCDGSMISANPGVNPSLSITAISELAMSKMPNKS